MHRGLYTSPSPAHAGILSLEAMTALFLTGAPGVGKTTALVEGAGRLRARGRHVRGIVTRELRERGRRTGFEVESFSGERATLSHVSIRSAQRVGKYGVDLDAFEHVALPALAPDGEAEPPPVYLVDEIGKMECLSDRFVEAVEHLLDRGVPLASADWMRFERSSESEQALQWLIDEREGVWCFADELYRSTGRSVILCRTTGAPACRLLPRSERRVEETLLLCGESEGRAEVPPPDWAVERHEPGEVRNHWAVSLELHDDRITLRADAGEPPTDRVGPLPRTMPLDEWLEEGEGKDPGAGG